MYGDDEDLSGTPAIGVLALGVVGAAMGGAAAGIAAGLVVGRWLATAFGYGWERAHRDDPVDEWRTA